MFYVLCSKRQYGLDHAEATARLRPILMLSGVHIPRKRVYLRALDIFSAYAHLDFEDAVIVAYMEYSGELELYSFDSDYDQVPGVTRVEP